MAENFLDGTGDKPISWWMFEESSTPFLDGNTTNNNDLSWTAPTARDSDHIEGSFSAFVTNDALSTANPNSTFANLSANFPFKGATTAFTLGGWLKKPAGSDGWLPRFSDNGPEGWYFYRGGAGNVDKAEGYCSPIGGGGTSIYSDNALGAGWRHVVLRWNGDNRSGAGANDEVSLWVDGVKQAQTTTVVTVGLCTTEALEFIGPGGLDTYYDEWFVFDVALLDTQIADIYAHGLAGDRNVASLMGAMAGFHPITGLK